MFIKIIALLAYLAMVAVNFMANWLPINNRTTGDISFAYPNLFAPAGLTFSIWGIIYLLLGGYVLIQFIKNKKTEGLINKINPFFIATSIVNILWIFAWHYDFIVLSVLLMVTLLILLIKIADIVGKNKLKSQEALFIRTPFIVYFGWITVATIANITVFLVSIGWNGFGIADLIWTAIILLVGVLIGVLRFNKDKSLAYLLVFAWAYFGILLKHIAPGGFNLQYPLIIITVIVCLAIFGLLIGKNIKTNL